MQDTNVIETTRLKIKRKKADKYQVILLNDNYTTMEFVVYILMLIFDKVESEARDIMFKVHIEGSAVCGVYSKDIAETKTLEVIRLAQKNSFPLRCVTKKI